MTRRRRLSLAVTLLLTCALAGSGMPRDSDVAPIAGPSPSAPAPAPALAPAPPVIRPTFQFGDRPSRRIAARVTAERVTYPLRGSRQFAYAAGVSPIVGNAGRLLRFQVAVERDITGISPIDFSAVAVATLGDPRSWSGTGQWRFQRVPAGSAYDF